MLNRLQQPFADQLQHSEKTQARVVLYTVGGCAYCQKAKELLGNQKVKYQEIPLDGDAKQHQLVIQKSGGRKVLPQLFIDSRHFGGFYELKRMTQRGNLQILLAR